MDPGGRASSNLLCLRVRRVHERFGGAAMARIAAHVLLPIGELPVDVAGHGNHHAREFLLRISVTGKITLHVAVYALDTERGAECPHRLNDLGAGHARHNF